MSWKSGIHDWQDDGRPDSWKKAGWWTAEESPPRVSDWSEWKDQSRGDDLWNKYNPSQEGYATRKESWTPKVQQREYNTTFPSSDIRNSPWNNQFYTETEREYHEAEQRGKYGSKHVRYKEKLCEYFQQGRCDKGWNCRNWHAKPEEVRRYMLECKDEYISKNSIGQFTVISNFVKNNVLDQGCGRMILQAEESVWMIAQQSWKQSKDAIPWKYAETDEEYMTRASSAFVAHMRRTVKDIEYRNSKEYKPHGFKSRVWHCTQCNSTQHGRDCKRCGYSPPKTEFPKRKRDDALSDEVTEQLLEEGCFDQGVSQTGASGSSMDGVPKMEVRLTSVSPRTPTGAPSVSSENAEDKPVGDSDIESIEEKYERVTDELARHTQYRQEQHDESASDHEERKKQKVVLKPATEEQKRFMIIKSIGRVVKKRRTISEPPNCKAKKFIAIRGSAGRTRAAAPPLKNDPFSKIRPYVGAKVSKRAGPRYKPKPVSSMTGHPEEGISYVDLNETDNDEVERSESESASRVSAEPDKYDPSPPSVSAEDLGLSPRNPVTPLAAKEKLTAVKAEDDEVSAAPTSIRKNTSEVSASTKSIRGRNCHSCDPVSRKLTLRSAKPVSQMEVYTPTDPEKLVPETPSGLVSPSISYAEAEKGCNSDGYEEINFEDIGVTVYSPEHAEPSIKWPEWDFLGDMPSSGSDRSEYPQSDKDTECISEASVVVDGQGDIKESQRLFEVSEATVKPEENEAD